MAGLLLLPQSFSPFHLYKSLRGHPEPGPRHHDYINGAELMVNRVETISGLAPTKAWAAFKRWARRFLRASPSLAWF